MKLLTLSLCAGLLVLFIACSPSDAYVKKAIALANYCNATEDCMMLGTKCPRSCNIYVNKHESEKIRTLLEKRDTICDYQCAKCPATCMDHRCVPYCG